MTEQDLEKLCSKGSREDIKEGYASRKNLAKGSVNLFQCAKHAAILEISDLWLSILMNL